MDSAPPQHPPNNLLVPRPTSSTHNPFSATPTSAPGSSMIYRFASNSVGPANAAVLDPKPFDGTIGAPNAGAFDGSSSSSLRPCEFNIDQAKKKRGRPRKYAPDNNIALGLTPTPTSTALASSALVAHGDSGGNEGGTPTFKRQRGRPSGSGKKQLDALGAGGVGFTPHVIMVKAGEDIASKIMSFSQQGPRTVCILSANGAICNVTLHHPVVAGGTVTFEGRYEIISLSGSLLSESSGSCSKNGGLSVSLAGHDGRVLGGGVAGMLLAATPVQVIVGSFVAEGKQSKNIAIPEPSSAPAPYMLNFGAAATAASPESQGASSESSDENGGGTFNQGSGLYSNPGQPMHSNSIQMYHHQRWAGQTQQ